VIRDHLRLLSVATIVGALALAPSFARADDAGATTDASASGAAVSDAEATSPHPPGVAERPVEAPGSTGLAPLAGEALPRNAQVTPGSDDPAAQRSMSFSAGGGECRDTIPGGPVLAAAYAVVLALLGLYAFVIGRKNAQLSAQLDELERVIAKKSERKDS
jgi:hypothetical protein